MKEGNPNFRTKTNSQGGNMRVYNLIALVLLALYIPSAPVKVDPAIHPFLELIEIETKARMLDHMIETSYNNETAPIKAVELDLKINESNQHTYTDDELKEMSYDTLLNVDKKFVYKKLKLAGKKNEKKELEKLAKAIARRHGISPNLFAALVKAESDYNKRCVSKKGAIGLCQIMPDNFKRLGITKPFDPIQNLNGGAKYFKYVLKYFKGNIVHALAAYNAGPGAVDDHGGIPPYEETENYVKKVIKYFKEYKKG